MNRYTQIFDSFDKIDKGLVYEMRFPDGEKGATNEIAESIHAGDEPLYKDLLHGGRIVFEEGRFLEPFYRRERCIILGAGHVSVPLSLMAKMTGFYVCVVDDRADFADKERFPQADAVICDSFHRALKQLKPAKQDYIVILTRGHKHDEECLEELFQYEEPAYVGLIGSKRRVAIVFDGLVKRGFDKARLDRVCTPIGLDIGAKTIEEIDIAIMAEIIQRRRKDRIDHVDIDRCDHDFISLQKLAKVSAPCALAIILSDEGSTPRSAGAAMAVFADGTIVGSIGGGCVEGAVIHKAKQLIGTGQYEIMHASLDGEAAMAEGMVCGGKLTVLVYDLI